MPTLRTSPHAHAALSDRMLAPRPARVLASMQSPLYSRRPGVHKSLLGSASYTRHTQQTIGCCVCTIAAEHRQHACA